MVGWVDLLWRRRSRVTTTSAGLAASLTEDIVESTNLLQTSLASEGFQWSDAVRVGSDEFLLECTIFEWFLRDLAMSYGFGRRTGDIRQALSGRVLVELQRSGLSPASLGDFGQRHRERFAEYTFSLGLSGSLQPLGALAWRRISGSDEPSERMTMLLARRASAEISGLRGLAEQYRVIEVAPSPPPSLDQA